MSPLVLYYPLFFILAALLIVMIRRGWRWYLAAELQLLAIASLALIGMRNGDERVLPAVCWLLLLLFVVVPGMLIRRGEQLAIQGKLAESERIYSLLRLLLWGKRGRFYRLHGEFVRLCAEGEAGQGEKLLDQVLSWNPPPFVQRGLVADKIFGCSLSRQWRRVLDLFEANPSSGTGRDRAFARMAALRAYAETGRIDNALLCLELLVESPFAADLAGGILLSKAVIFALSGDMARLVELFQANQKQTRKLPPSVESYWLGRCHLCRGEFAETRRRLQRALELTPPENAFHRRTIQEFLVQAEAGVATPTQPPVSYERDLAEIDRRAKASEDFRLLVARGLPGPATLTMLGLLFVVFAATILNPRVDADLILERFGNWAQPVAEGEWWRVVTALFLHADWLHLGLNGFALWVLGRPTERYFGTERFLILFFGSGILANLVSNWLWPGREVAIGASGGICGLLGALWIAFAGVRAPRLRGVRNRICIFLGAAIILQVVIDLNVPQIDKVAHLAGGASGVVLACALKPKRKDDSHEC